MAANEQNGGGDVERAAFLNQVTLEVQKTKASLDAELGGMRTHGLELSTGEELRTLRLRTSSFTALELVPDESRNAIALNNYLGDKTGSLEQEMFINPADAAGRFAELAPVLVSRFEDRIEELRSLGIVA